MDKGKKKLVIGSVFYIILILGVKLINYSTPIYLLNKQMNGINLIPLSTITEYVTNYNMYNTSIIVKVILSLFIFVPLVVYMFYALKKDDKLSLINILVISLIVSLLTSILLRVLNLGVFDIDIVILRSIVMVTTFMILNLLYVRMEQAGKA